jgi:hypothetical protein
LGFTTLLLLFVKIIIPSPRKITAMSRGFGNPACCVCEFSGLKGKVKLSCSLLRTIVITLLQLCAEVDSG